MGVILRQGLKHSVITFIATLVGMVNVLFIYTFFLTKQELGLFQYLISWAKFLAPFLLVGFTATSIRFYSKFKEKSPKDNGFLFFLLVIPIISFFVFALTCWIFKNQIFGFIAQHPDADLLRTYLPYAILLIFSLIFSGLLTSYISNLKLIAVPEIFNNLWLKVAIPILAVLYFYSYIDLSNFILGIVLAYLVATLALFIYLWKLGELDLKPNWRFFDKKIVNEIRSFATFSLLGGVGTLIATQIDTLMVGSLINMENAAVYTIALYISTVIGIPLRSVFNITSPIIAESFNRNDLANIQKYYHKSSLNLLIIGVLLLVGIWASVDQLFAIIPNGQAYKAGKYVLLLLGLAKLVDMSTSINAHIIIYSKFYKYNLYFSLLLAVLNVIFNLLFIPQFQLIGVAIATLTSMILFNLLKVLFVWYKFKMQPFSTDMIWIILLGIIAYLSTFLLPNTGFTLLDIFLNSIVISLIYVPTILYFNLSEDLTLLKQKLQNQVRKILDR